MCQNSRGKSGGALLHYLGISRTRKGYCISGGFWSGGGRRRWTKRGLYPAGPRERSPAFRWRGICTARSAGVDPCRNYLRRQNPSRAGVGAAVHSRVAEPLRGRATAEGSGRHGLASAGAGGCCKIALSPAFLGVYWEKGGKLRCLIFGWIPSWRCAATGTTRGRRRS